VKSFFAFLSTVVVIAAVVWVLSPPTAEAFADRVVHYFEPMPPVEAPAAAAPGPAGAAALAPPPPSAAEWRRKDREAIRAYEEGDFLGAAALWGASAAKAPASEVLRVRAARDRANVFALLAEGAARVEGIDPAAAETEYRRRLDALRDPAAGAWLELADYAAARGLRHHLAFLFERAFERRVHADSEAEVSRKVTRVLRERKEAVAAMPPEVLESVISDLPSSEAAEAARELSGGGSGIAGSSSRERRMRAQDSKKMAEARRLMAEGDAEYRLAVPGSREVNVHRRKALDLYLKARALFEEVDRDSGFDAHGSEIHDLNRNIVELRKDLPIGK